MSVRPFRGVTTPALISATAEMVSLCRRKTKPAMRHRLLVHAGVFVDEVKHRLVTDCHLDLAIEAQERREFIGTAPVTVVSARRHLKVGGWSYRSAAKVLGVHPVHLSEVLNGHRSSLRLLNAITRLQPRH